MCHDNVRMMRTPIGIKGSLDIDVLAGKSSFRKNNELVSPAIVHFAGLWNEYPIYYREALKLRNLSEGQTYHINNGTLLKIHRNMEMRSL